MSVLAAHDVAGVGCGTNAHGTGACRSVEQARCRRASTACPDLLATGNEADLDSCLEAARDRCLQGMALPSDPLGVQVDACVKAIGQATCDAVRSPELLPECAVLFSVPVDAAADVPASTD